MAGTDVLPVPAYQVEVSSYGSKLQVGAYGDTKWNAASQGPELKNWRPQIGSADSDMWFEEPEVRARVRDLDRNESLATGFLDTMVNSVVGTGIMPIPRPDYVILGKDKAWADAWSRKVRAMLHEYLMSTDVDAARKMNFGMLQGIVLRSMLGAGGIIALPVWLPDDCKKSATAFHLVEIDRLSNPDWSMPTRYLREGIEVNEFGKPLAYHMLAQHPGEMFLVGSVWKWYRIPAEVAVYNAQTGRYVGRPRVLHVYDPQRPGQTRGMSLLATVVPQFKTLSDFKKAQLHSALNAAMFAFFIRSQQSAVDIQTLFKGNTDSYMEARGAWNKDLGRKKLGMGSVVPLMPGDEIEQFLPTNPNPNSIEFIRTVGRDIATSLNLPLEMIDHDWSKMNYSSARTAILDGWRTFKRVGHVLNHGFSQPAVRLWFEEKVHAGEIPDCTPEDYYSNVDAWTRCKWMPQAKGWVDPVKEAQAAQIRMSIGISTLEDECAEQGRDWQDVADQRAMEKDYYETVLGIPYPGDQAPPGERLWEEDGDGQQAGQDNGDSPSKPASTPAKKPAAKPAKKKSGGKNARRPAR